MQGRYGAFSKARRAYWSVFPTLAARSQGRVFHALKTLKGAWVKKKFLKHFLPLGFLFVLIVALVWPQPGDYIAKWKVGSFRLVQTINVCTVFVISGLTLKTDDIKAAVKAYVGFFYGLVAILAITPCLGFLAVEIPFSPKEFAIGLAIFASVPTTITSGVTLVLQANGNGALGLMLTVASNLLGIVTTPFAISLIISSGSDIKIDTVELLIKLIFTILIPLIVGKVIRELSAKVRKVVAAYKVPLGLISNGSLICIVWQTLSRSQEEILDQSLVNILQIIAAGVVMHFIYLLWNVVVVGFLRLNERERRAVIIMASQKTLPVAITVIGFLDEAKVGRSGLITIPCIVGHMSQLFIDAVIVSRWSGMPIKEEKNEGNGQAIELAGSKDAADVSGNPESSAGSSQPSTSDNAEQKV